MSIASQLTALQTDITNARTQITTMGGTVTVSGGSSQLATDISTIPTGGSGDLPIGSTITVTSDEGATIEIERGTESQTLVVPSSGSVSFTVHQSGIWNITANKTGETELTDSVVVSADDTMYTKTIRFFAYILRNGVINTSLVGNFVNVDATSFTDGKIIGSRSDLYGALFGFSSQINISNYSTLHIIGKTWNSYGDNYRFRFGLFSELPSRTTWVNNMNKIVTAVVLPISETSDEYIVNLTSGNYYVAGMAISQYEISEIWFEP